MAAYIFINLFSEVCALLIAMRTDHQNSWLPRGLLCTFYNNILLDLNVILKLSFVRYCNNELIMLFYSILQAEVCGYTTKCRLRAGLKHCRCGTAAQLHHSTYIRW